MRADDIEEGKTYEVTCPFVRTMFEGIDEDGPFEAQTWKPGVEFVGFGPEGSPTRAVADGEGKVLYTVVGVYSPPRPYHPRVFYVREFIDPDGKRFGNKQLRIKGIQSFRRWLTGWRYGGYDRDGYEIRSANDNARAGTSGVSAHG